MKIIESETDRTIYQKLKMLKEGLISPKEVDDDLIDSIRPNGIIILNFYKNNLSYFELFGFEDYDVRFIESLFSNYGTDELVDMHDVATDWRDGNIIDFFDKENLDLFKNICNLMGTPFVYNEDEKIVKIMNRLEDLFDREVRDIQYELLSIYQNVTEENIKEAIKEELCDVFSKFNIFSVTGCFYKYATTVKNLLTLFEQFEYSKAKNLFFLLKEIGLSLDKTGDWYEYRYEYQSRRLDKEDLERINSTINWNLEKIQSKIIEEGDFKDLIEYEKITDFIEKKFGFSRVNKVPKNKNFSFYIKSVDPVTNKISVYFFKTLNASEEKKRMMDVEELNLFLYHPEIEFGE